MRRGPNGPRTLCNACGLMWANKVIMGINHIQVAPAVLRYFYFSIQLQFAPYFMNFSSFQISCLLCHFCSASLLSTSFSALHLLILIVSFILFSFLFIQVWEVVIKQSLVMCLTVYDFKASVQIQRPSTCFIVITQCRCQTSFRKFSCILLLAFSEILY